MRSHTAISFFFQAEDGIRDIGVTGVQTCALPIFSAALQKERVMSTSNVVNANCVLRRNLKRQPYGRCSVCTLQLRGCHAWQASVLSFGMIIFALAATVVPAGWPLRAIALGIIALVVAEGRANHRRTDQLIYSAYALREHN